MIKLSAITEMFKYYGDTRYETNDLITEFDDSKDSFEIDNIKIYSG